VRGLLTEGEAGSQPATALVPLHAGMGTAFAEKLFQGLGASPSVQEIRNTLERFVDVCGANCRPGWEDATIEPFGLVVRCLYPQLVSSTAAAAGELSARLRALFWHGVGRGLYFVPGNFLPLPGARKRMMQSAAEEAADIADRRNLLAGLVWAVTLVNLPHPAIVRSLAAVCSDLRMRSEFTNGLISALMAWRHMAPEDIRYTSIYTNLRVPGGADESQWKHWIAQPARDALDNVFPGLKERNNIPSLYTYRTYEELCRLSA
jgi:hypothetical protein